MPTCGKHLVICGMFTKFNLISFIYESPLYVELLLDPLWLNMQLFYPGIRISRGRVTHYHLHHIGNVCPTQSDTRVPTTMMNNYKVSFH